MQVLLLNYTKEPLLVIYTAARTCYSSLLPGKILAGLTKSKDLSYKVMESLIKKVVNSGHHSVLEHVSFTFAISGISRACSHQLVRHRIASYSQQSQRYVKPGANVVIPPSIYKNKSLNKEFHSFIEEADALYKKLLANEIPREDARFVLPNAVATNIVMTMNLRELINVCSQRLCLRAQWEIRELFTQVKERVKEVNSFLGNLLVPKCISLGFCPEEQSCGLMPKQDMDSTHQTRKKVERGKP